jgi:Na+/phosphate symporter
MHLLAKTMLNDSVESFIHRDQEQAKEVLSRDEDVDLLNWLINRQYNLILQDLSLSEKLKISPQRGLGFLLFAKSLERIADHASKIASMERMHGEDDLLHGDLKLITDRLVRSIEMAVGSFFSREFDTANLVINDVRKQQDELQKLIEEGVMKGDEDMETSMAHAFLLDSLKCVCAYTIDIAETSINNQFVED